jgi:hypothetical protein
MSKSIKEHASLLRKLHKTSPAIRAKLLKHKCDRSFIECLSKCAKNVLKGNVPLNKKQLENLRRRKRQLRTLALKKTTFKTKRQIIQSGGFLGALIGPIVSILGSLFKQQ